MECYQWLNELGNKVSLPIVVKYDNSYEDTLRGYFEKILYALSSGNANKCIQDVAVHYTSKILQAIKDYYCGSIIEAHSTIKELFEDCCQNNEYAISDINNSPTFKKFSKNNEEVQFFRARLNENVVDFAAKDMLHIPFDRRAIVNSCRFSIPGLPCLYLGNTSYVCWIEMGCPAEGRVLLNPFSECGLRNTIFFAELRLSFSVLVQRNKGFFKILVIFGIIVVTHLSFLLFLCLFYYIIFCIFMSTFLV